MTDTAATLARTSSETVSNRKRSRSEEDVLFRLSQWITSPPHGGFCHEAIAWKAETRELIASQDIAKDTQIFVIPDSCIITEKRVELSPQQQEEIVNAASANLHHKLPDALVAWYLATQPPALAAYLDSLAPIRNIAQALPRHWPTDILQQYLQGSPVLRRLAAQQQGVTRDYHVLRQTELVTQPDRAPSLQAFDHALAVVSSRAFAGPDDESSPSCLIPLLDLCNHQRGAAAEPKNLRYAWDRDTGSMMVHAARAIAKGDTLCITYGAQSNGQLLVNYGFCIPDNVEPDGSSNNFYEFQPTPSLPSSVFLRMGPKSYTYGPLVQVLEALGPQDARQKGDHDDQNDHDDDAVDGGLDDMEAFLNECEQEADEEDACGDDCMYTNALDGPGQDEGGDDVEEQKTFDRQALENFRTRLAMSMEAYNETAKFAQERDTRVQYAEILVESEKEILRFYRATATQLLARLDGGKPGAEPEVPDTQMEQIQSLIAAFFHIRYTML